MGLSLPSSEIAAGQDADAPLATAAAALGSAGFAPTLGLRWGTTDRIEPGLRIGAGEIVAGPRIAVLRPDDGWDLTVAIAGSLAFLAPDAGREDIEVEGFVRGGGAVGVTVGRTWSDFLSVWLAARGEVGGYDLDATLDGKDASHAGLASRFGGSFGVRVGFRRFFAGIELSVARASIGTQTGTIEGLVLYPAFGVSYETR
ncbi:MAG: hypothetical protein HYY06_23125 [Deltaproteobacteria bacterium]|nr:hypothetical protein [Deltaproteobacteria bacterium]